MTQEPAAGRDQTEAAGRALFDAYWSLRNTTPTGEVAHWDALSADGRALYRGFAAQVTREALLRLADELSAWSTNEDGWAKRPGTDDEGREVCEHRAEAFWDAAEHVRAVATTDEVKAAPSAEQLEGHGPELGEPSPMVRKALDQLDQLKKTLREDERHG